MTSIVLVTGNKHKLRELEALATSDMQFINQAIDLDEIQSLDLHEIITDKARRAYTIIKQPVIVEDVSTGLDALHGLPGPFFKFFEQTLGKRTLLELSAAQASRVTIKCLAAYYDGTQIIFGEGIITGHVVEPRGENGFGFDFTVVPDRQTKTMAEMTLEEKNAISHRGQAFRNLLENMKSAGVST